MAEPSPQTTESTTPEETTATTSLGTTVPKSDPVETPTPEVSVDQEGVKNVDTPDVSSIASATDSDVSKAPPVKEASPQPPSVETDEEVLNKKETRAETKVLKDAEKIYYDGMATIRDMIAPSSLEIDTKYIKVSDTYSRSFFVYTYPRFLEANWLGGIINRDITIDISLFVYPAESAHILKVLRKKVAQMRSTIRINQQKGRVNDPGIEIALQDAEELRMQLTKGEEKFFHLGVYLALYAKSEEQLDKLTTEIETLLGGKMILTKRANLQHEHGFHSCLPLCLDDLQVTRNMNTSPLSSTFPFTSAELTSDKGILYGLNRHNDSLIIFDRFSLENANSVIFAKSGAGKSYAVKLEILRLLMTGVDVLVIDPEKEYSELSDKVNGTFINISLNSAERINPFDLPEGLKDEELSPGDLLRSSIINLHGLLKLMVQGVTPEEEAMLDKALLDVYALKGINFETETLTEFEAPTMSDLHNILSSMKGGESVARRLEKFTTGTYAGIFNQKTNVNLKSGLIVFNIRDLEDELRPIATYIVLNFIWNKVRSELKKRFLVVDEAWSLMQHEDSAKFLYGLVKRARKYWLGITTITQDVEDFLRSKYGKPIITNSSMQLLLKQAPASMDELTKVFNLTEGEKYMLLSAGIGQGLFFAGNKHVACQIIASYSENKVIVTTPEEVVKQREAKKQRDEAEAGSAEETVETPDASLEASAKKDPGVSEEAPSEEQPLSEPQVENPVEAPDVSSDSSSEALKEESLAQEEGDISEEPVEEQSLPEPQPEKSVETLDSEVSKEVPEKEGSLPEPTQNKNEI